SSNAGVITFASAVSFNNYGIVDIETGTLTCIGNVINNGAVNLSSGTTIQLAGGGSAAGMFNAPPNTLVQWIGGSFTLNPGAQLNGSGLYKIAGGVVVANSPVALLNLDLTSGALNGSGTVTINNAMSWPGGSMGGSGR